jgi:predicted ABC-class ATPase
MKSSSNLKSLLKNIDRKGYPAYKSTQGTYDFGTYFLSIDHVQGDPFASPSKLSIHVKDQLDFLLLFMIQNINRLHSVII